MTFTENLGIYFPYTGGGATSGINDTGIETFNDDPIHSLVKETIQNSLDERSSNASEPVVVKFNLHEIDNNQFPYLDNLKNVLNSCKKYCIEYNNSDKKTLDIINKGGGRDTCKNRPLDFETIGMTDLHGFFYFRNLSISKLDIGSISPSKSIVYSPNLLIWLVK
ncbi:MAG: hypothetical protein RR712_04620 [Terrisporobacter sp.]